MSAQSLRPALVLAVILAAGGSACLAAPSAVPNTPAALTDSALAPVRELIVLHNGRVKPFDSFAREIVALLTGRPRVGRQDPVATLLAIGADPSGWADARLLAVPFRPLRDALGLDAQVTHISYNELVESRRLMRMLPAIVEKQRRDEKLNTLEEETLDLFDRFAVFTTIMQRDVRLVPPTAPGDREWVPVLETPLKASWDALFDAVGADDGGRIRALARELRAAAHDVNPAAWPPAWRLRLELRYNRAEPFQASRVLYGLAALLLLIGLWRGAALRRAGIGVMLLAALVHGAGIMARVLIGGRPPVSNFYETMLWLPFVAVVLALIFEVIYRAGYFGLSAAVLAAITLLLADVVPLDSSVTPVVAVLRSTLWLTIHVLTIIASYGALALATVLAHVYGVRYCARGGSPASCASLDLALYRTIQVGVVLLAAGIMLGAVWANASWGRYWGWDPKETWALITLMWYIAVLHGRFAGWLRGVGVALSTIAGFFLLLMTYYGVSFYLVGLHSYAGGHAKPLPPLLIGYLVAEAAFLAVVGGTALARRRTA